jgi:formylglycine-generating enzyme required for sulfatase activity
MIYRSWSKLEAHAATGAAKTRQKATEIRDTWLGEFESIAEGKLGTKAQGLAAALKNHLLTIPAGRTRLGTSEERQRWPELERKALKLAATFRDPTARDKWFSARSYYQTRAGRIQRENVILGFDRITSDGTKQGLEQDKIREKQKEYILREFNAYSIIKPKEFIFEPFLLGRQTISNSWYQLFDQRHIDNFENYRKHSASDAHPVICVSFFDAWVFSKWLHWEGESCRLPFEAEWEAAAKYGFPDLDLEYWWEVKDNSVISERNFTSERINCRETRDKSRSKYGHSLVPSPSRASPHSKHLDLDGIGLMDMQGNVWEWCQDVYQAQYAEDLEKQIKKTEANASKPRVCRGGSFTVYGRYASASHRLHFGPSRRSIHIGFRVSRVPCLGCQ